jgi:hypothetical protein
MTWEPDDLDGAVARVTRSIESFGAACERSGLRGAVVLVDGAFDAAWCGGDLPASSPSEVIDEARAVAEMYGLGHRVRWSDGWPAESFKLTAALRLAANTTDAPALIRLDSDETLTDDTDLGAALDAMRGHHGAQVTWDTVGEQAHGSQQVGTKRHLRMFTSSPTLTAGPAYHGSYKVHDGEWLALRKRGEENAGLANARVVDCSSIVTITNHPAERGAAMHEAKARLLAHRYEGAMSDR